MSNFTHAMLADIVGTTRPRISFFMKKFRELGLIRYHKGNGDIIIMVQALTDSILHDEGKPKRSPAVPDKQK